MSANDDPGSCWSDDVDCLPAMSADDVSGFLGEISPLSSRPGDRTAQMDENGDRYAVAFMVFCPHR